MTAREVLACLGAVRRGVAVSVAGLATTVLLVGGCSSSTAGSGGGGGGFPGASSAPVSVPSATGGSGGGSGSDFCSEWLSGSSVGGLSGQIGANFVAHWDKLADLAPAEIKSDVQAIDDYLHSALGHQPDPAKAATLATAIGNVVKYVAQNCH